MIILHGDDDFKSREVLNKLVSEAKLKNRVIVRYEAKEVDLTDITQVIESTGLWGNDQFLILFGPFSLIKSKKKDKLVEYLKDHQEANLLLFEAKAVSAASLKPFSAAKIIENKPPALIFSFLDNLAPGEPEKALARYQVLLEHQTPPELIFAMLVRQVRLLLQAQSLKLPPWMKNKLLSQSKLFGQTKLLSLHDRLFTIDRHLKTGRNPLDLSTQIFNLLANL